MPPYNDINGCQYILIIPTPHALKFVEDAIVLIEIAQLPAKVVMDRDSFHWLRLHVNVPDFERHVVPRENISAIVAKFDV